MGHFNYDSLKVNKDTDVNFQNLNSYGIVPAYNFPTRITENSRSCIDWVLSNSRSNELINDIRCIDVSCSDHCLVFFKYKKKPLIKSNQYKTCLNFKETDYLKFNAYLYDNLNFSSIESFIDYVHNGINICVPVHKIKFAGGCSPTYISNDYFRVSRLGDEIYHNYLVTRKKVNNGFF